MLRTSAWPQTCLKGLCAAASIAICTVWSAPAEAQSPVLFSPDITAEFGTVGPDLVEDDDAAADDAAGGVIPVLVAMLAALPSGAEIGALEISSAPGVGALLSVDTTVSLPGLPPATPLEPRDVARFDPTTSSFSLFFDGSLNSVPSGVRLDALTLDAANDLVMSFDTTLALPGAGVVDDEDLVRFSGGTYSVFFDGSAEGISRDLDLDAAHLDAVGKLLLSFDATGAIGALRFDDEDVVAFDSGAMTFALHFDASLSDPSDWPRADLVALPEPDAVSGLGAGVVALSLLTRSRGVSRRGASRRSCSS
jgi:hypothetical protein